MGNKIFEGVEGGVGNNPKQSSKALKSKINRARSKCQKKYLYKEKKIGSEKKMRAKVELSSPPYKYLMVYP